MSEGGRERNKEKEWAERRVARDDFGRGGKSVRRSTENGLFPVSIHHIPPIIVPPPPPPPSLPFFFFLLPFHKIRDGASPLIFSSPPLIPSLGVRSEDLIVSFKKCDEGMRKKVYSCMIIYSIVQMYSLKLELLVHHRVQGLINRAHAVARVALAAPEERLAGGVAVG